MTRALVLSMVVTACGNGRPGGSPDSGYELQLGTAPVGGGGAGFETMPLQATLVPGAQGGFHVWLQYRVKGELSTTMTASHTVRRESDGVLLSRGERRLKLDDGVEGEDGWWQADTATPAFLCPTPLGVSAIDVHAVFEVKLTKDGVEQATQQVKTQLKCPTDGQADFCAKICEG